MRPVADLVQALAEAWGDGCRWEADPSPQPHEAKLLAVDSALARARLGWRPRLSFERTVRMTADWYRRHLAGAAPERLVLDDIARYAEAARAE
jgi:CDP-glucose 4,6-dehydratase